MSSNEPSQRQLRVGENVRHVLQTLLQRGVVTDPDLDGKVVSVTEVRMSPDLKIATVFVTAFGQDDMQPLIRALARNVKIIRKEAARDLRQMKYMPDFRFLADDSFDNFQRINDLLKTDKVRQDLDGEDE